MGDPTEHNIDAENRFRRIRFADSVRVAGEAFTLRFEFEAVSPEPTRAATATLRKTLMAAIETELARLNGVAFRRPQAARRLRLPGRPDVSYRVERHHETLVEGVFTLTVTVHGIVTEDQAGYRVRRASGSSSSGGELWVNSIDRFLERTRSRMLESLSRIELMRDAYVACSWLPGAGILISGGGVGDDGQSTYLGVNTDEAKRARELAYMRELEEEMWGRQGRERSLRARRRADMIRALVLASVLIAALIFVPLLGLPATVSVAFSVIVPEVALLVFALFFSWRAIQIWREQRDVAREIQELSDRIEIARLPDGMGKESYKLFKLNGNELKRYYDQALGQRGWVFAIGVVCILAGFASVGVAFYLIQNAEAADSKIAIAIIGAIGTILADFIAVIYLRMFSDIVKSAGEFHLRLVGTHHLHFANVLAGRIHEDQPLANSTLAAMAVSLAKSELPKVPPSEPAKEPQSARPRTSDVAK